MSEETRKIDALLIVKGTNWVGSLNDKIDSIRPLLKEIFGAGKQVHLRSQDNEVFVTSDLADTLLFAVNHPRAGQSRYDWEDQNNGLKYGFKVEGA